MESQLQAIFQERAAKLPAGKFYGEELLPSVESALETSFIGDGCQAFATSAA
ncbi:MAG: hypothetical protein V4443_12285 [Pseudomonadota bacterium]